MLLDRILAGRSGTFAAAAPCPRAAIIGICKNAGKTVALNHLIAEASAAGVRLALASSGRDGEAKDAITDLPKPRITAPPGAWLATARGALTPAVTVVGELPLATPLGPMVVGRATAGGEVVLVGPGSSQALAAVLSALEAASGAAGEPPALTLVDGAFDRLAAASPDLTDTVVLAVGAAYSPSQPQTLAQAAFLLDVLRLPRAPLAAEPLAAALALGRPALVLPGTAPLLLGVASALADPAALLAAAAAILDRPPPAPVPARDPTPTSDPPPAGAPPPAVDHAPAALVLPGALTDGLLQAWLLNFRHLTHRLTVVLPDATHVLAHRDLWRRWRRLGGEAAVQRPIRVAAVTANAHSPVGASYNPNTFFAALSEVAADLPVFDLVQGMQCRLGSRTGPYARPSDGPGQPGGDRL